ncbi:MAG TPA: cysteine dioxygenase family protein [Acidimicrobiales bacterium]
MTAGPQLGPSELLAAVGRLARTRPIADGSLLRCPIPPGASRRWYEPVFAGYGLEAWLLWWFCGGEIDLHDHGGASGAIHVLEGSLLETRGSRHGRGLRQRNLRAGESIAFGSDYVHDVINIAAEPAVSLHVYGPRLEAMTYYRINDQSGRLIPDRLERLEPIAAAMPLTGPLP